MPQLRILSRADLRACIDMPTAIQAVREAFVRLATGQARAPIRAAVPVPPNATMLVMPARVAASGLGLKVVSVTPDNPGHGLPLIHALVIVLDPVTCAPLAALEGGWLTAWRTGAASGVATDLLARPDARRLTVFGAGAQAGPQALAVCAVRAIERITLCSRTPSRAAALAEQLAGQPGIPADIRVLTNPAEAVADADVVCTATTSPAPVFPGIALRPGVHVNAIGAFTPTARETDDDLAQRARLVCDERSAAMEEAGDLVIPWQAGLIGGPETWAELGQIAAGLAPGRQSAAEVTFFKSVGNAVQDVAVASIAVARAAERGLGALVAL